MSDITLNIALNIFATFLAFLFGMEIFVPRFRQVPLFYWRKFRGIDKFQNLYGDFFCYRITGGGKLAEYTIQIKPGYGADPICVWENVSTSAPRMFGRVVSYGSKYALIFDDKIDRLPSLILLHAEGPSASRSIKMGIQTGVLATDPSTIYSGAVILSREKIASPEKYLKKTNEIPHGSYLNLCAALVPGDK